MRAADACNLTIPQSDSRTGVLSIEEGKGDKDRPAFLQQIALEKVHDYVKRGRPELLKKMPRRRGPVPKGETSLFQTDIVFVSSRGRRGEIGLTPSGILQMLSRRYKGRRRHRSVVVRAASPASRHRGGIGLCSDGRVTGPRQPARQFGGETGVAPRSQHFLDGRSLVNHNRDIVGDNAYRRATRTAVSGTSRAKTDPVAEALSGDVPGTPSSRGCPHSICATSRCGTERWITSCLDAYAPTVAILHCS